MKVLSVVGTRPEAIKMAPVINRLKGLPHLFDSRVCVTGQHREMLDQVFHLFSLRADHDLDIMTPGQTLTDITCAVLRGLARVLAAEKPDWVLVQGDTTTAMAASMAAFYQNIPVGHVEAGLRTYDVMSPFPEEMNRRLTGLVAAAHFAPTQWAAENLRREAVPDRQIFVTGNTVIDAFKHVAALPFNIKSTPLADVPLDSRLVLVTVHRRENLGRRLTDICTALRDLADMHPEVRLVMPVHPNPRVREPVFSLLQGVTNISLLPPLDYHPLVWLIGRCDLLITDSGGIQEEATGIGKPTLVLRESTERPEGVLAGTARLVGADPKVLLYSASKLLTDEAEYCSMVRATSPYGTGRAAHQIVNVLSAVAGGTVELVASGELDAEAYGGSEGTFANAEQSVAERLYPIPALHGGSSACLENAARAI